MQMPLLHCSAEKRNLLFTLAELVTFVERTEDKSLEMKEKMENSVVENLPNENSIWQYRGKT